MNGFYETSVTCGVNANDSGLSSLHLEKVKQNLQKNLRADKDCAPVQRIERPNLVKVVLRLPPHSVQRLRLLAEKQPEALKSLGVQSLQFGSLIKSSSFVNNTDTIINNPNIVSAGACQGFIAASQQQLASSSSSSAVLSSRMNPNLINHQNLMYNNQALNHNSVQDQSNINAFPQYPGGQELYQNVAPYYHHQQRPGTSSGTRSVVYHDQQQQNFGYQQTDTNNYMYSNSNSVNNPSDFQATVCYNTTTPDMSSGFSSMQHQLDQRQQPQQVFFSNGGDQMWNANNGTNLDFNEANYWNYQQQQDYCKAMQQQQQPPQYYDNQPQQQQQMVIGQNASPLLVNLLQQQSPPSALSLPRNSAATTVVDQQQHQFLANAAVMGQLGTMTADSQQQQQPPTKKRRKNTAANNGATVTKVKGYRKNAAAQQQQQQVMNFNNQSGNWASGYAQPTSSFGVETGTLQQGPQYSSQSMMVGNIDPFSASVQQQQQQQQMIYQKTESPFSSCSPVKGGSGPSPSVSFSSPVPTPNSGLGCSSSGPGGVQSSPSSSGEATNREASINSVIDSVMLRYLNAPSPSQSSPQTNRTAPRTGKAKNADLKIAYQCSPSQLNSKGQKIAPPIPSSTSFSSVDQSSSGASAVATTLIMAQHQQQPPSFLQMDQQQKMQQQPQGGSNNSNQFFCASSSSEQQHQNQSIMIQQQQQQAQITPSSQYQGQTQQQQPSWLHPQQQQHNIMQVQYTQQSQPQHQQDGFQQQQQQQQNRAGPNPNSAPWMQAHQQMPPPPSYGSAGAMVCHVTTQPQPIIITVGKSGQSMADDTTYLFNGPTSGVGSGGSVDSSHLGHFAAPASRTQQQHAAGAMQAQGGQAAPQTTTTQWITHDPAKAGEYILTAATATASAVVATPIINNPLPGAPQSGQGQPTSAVHHQHRHWTTAATAVVVGQPSILKDPGAPWNTGAASYDDPKSAMAAMAGSRLTNASAPGVVNDATKAVP